ncbi:MAG: hypothetical protein FJ315_07795, partial [SAR202 cluster bacterium]|nr:hypothetical protein [SAR202 cluster bacterium]
MSSPELGYQIESRNQRYRRELEDYFREWLVEQYAERAAVRWRREYGSVTAYEASVAPMREEWRALLNPPELVSTGPLQAAPCRIPGAPRAEWVRVSLGRISAEAILALPEDRNGPFPLIIAQHGIGSSPEKVFGLEDEQNLYHSYGLSLLRAGYAVLAPFNLA